VADLKGKKVAATKGTDPYLFLLRALQGAKLQRSDIEHVALQHADGKAALEQGRVDAWAGLDPLMAASELDAGSRIIYRNIAFNTYGFLNFRQDFMAQQPALARRVIAAYERARQWTVATSATRRRSCRRRPRSACRWRCCSSSCAPTSATPARRRACQGVAGRRAAAAAGATGPPRHGRQPGGGRPDRHPVRPHRDPRPAERACANGHAEPIAPSPRCLTAPACPGRHGAALLARQGRAAAPCWVAWSLVRLAGVPAHLLPPPTEVLRTLGELSDQGLAGRVAPAACACWSAFLAGRGRPAGALVG
jgi:hypothetical protein